MPPFFLIPFLAKNLTFWNLYTAAEKYGFPRLYRRLLEGINQLQVPPAQAKVIRAAIKEGFRSPNTAYSLLRNSEVADFLLRYSEHLVVYKDKLPKVPPVVVSIAEVILKKSSLGKFIHVFEKVAKKH